MNILIFIAVFITSFISFITTLLVKDIKSGYQFMILLPIVYIIIYILFIHKLIFKRKSITASMYAAYSYIRFVVIPFFIAISGDYGIPYIAIDREEYYSKAIILIIYELSISSIILNYFVRKKMPLSKSFFESSNLHSQLEFKITGMKKAYIVYILLALIIYVFVPDSRSLLSFVKISSSKGRINESLPLNFMIIRQIFIVALIISFLILLDRNYKKYKFTSKKIYIYYSIILGLLNVGVIMGERRYHQVYTALVVIYILGRLYKESRKKIIVFVSIFVCIVLIGMSIYKHFYAFNYTSYLEAIKYGSGTGWGLANTLQAYFFGIQNVAAAVNFAELYQNSISTLIYDFLRSTIGISFLVKGAMMTTTELFNTHIYGVYRATGHVLSSVGYGYIYFGFLLSPLFTCISVYSSILIEKKMKKSCSFEVVYFLAYILARTSMSIFANPTAIVNTISLMGISYGFIYICSRLLRLLTNTKNSNINRY